MIKRIWGKYRSLHIVWQIVIGVTLLGVVIAPFGEDPAAVDKDPAPVAAGESAAAKPETKDKATTTTSEATTTTAAPTTTTEAPSGDWESVDAYKADMLDTLGKVSAITELMSETYGQVASLQVTPAEGGEVAAAAQAAVQTHVAHFATKAPPVAYTDAQELFVAALTSLDEGLGVAAQAMPALDSDAMARSNSLVERAAAQLNEANELL